MDMVKELAFMEQLDWKGLSPRQLDMIHIAQTALFENRNAKYFVFGVEWAGTYDNEYLISFEGERLLWQRVEGYTSHLKGEAIRVRRRHLIEIAYKCANIYPIYNLEILPINHTSRPSRFLEPEWLTKKLSY